MGARIVTRIGGHAAILIHPASGFTTRGALTAKLAYRNGGESGVVFVGARNTLTVDAGEYGRLLLGINDDRTDDNRGEFVVRLAW